jgi:hypothetical protein
MKTILKQLLNRLDAISNDNGEVGDTDVREQMSEAVYHTFIMQTPGYTLPSEFGMFGPAGNAAVHAALSEFVAAACGAGLSTPQERFSAFQDSSVLSDAGHPYDEYFGYSDNLDEWSAAMSRPATSPATSPAKPWWQFWK